MMKSATLTAFIILATSLVSACGASTPSATGPPSSGASTSPATGLASPTNSAVNGLTAARYPECNYGDRLLHYLATGDNGGDPWFDKNFASYVGTTVPQARALTDASIEQCNKSKDDAAAAQASAQADAQSSASAQASTDAQTAQDQRLATIQTQACAAIGGILNKGYNVADNNCKSATPDAPSGPAGTLCGYGSVELNPDGSIAQESYASAKQNYPGCFK